MLTFLKYQKKIHQLNFNKTRVRGMHSETEIASSQDTVIRFFELNFYCAETNALSFSEQVTNYEAHFNSPLQAEHFVHVLGQIQSEMLQKNPRGGVLFDDRVRLLDDIGLYNAAPSRVQLKENYVNIYSSFFTPDTYQGPRLQVSNFIADSYKNHPKGLPIHLEETFADLANYYAHEFTKNKPLSQVLEEAAQGSGYYLDAESFGFILRDIRKRVSYEYSKEAISNFNELLITLDDIGFMEKTKRGVIFSTDWQEKYDKFIEKQNFPAALQQTNLPPSNHTHFSDTSSNARSDAGNADIDDNDSNCPDETSAKGESPQFGDNCSDTSRKSSCPDEMPDLDTVPEEFSVNPFLYRLRYGALPDMDPPDEEPPINPFLYRLRYGTLPPDEYYSDTEEYATFSDAGNQTDCGEETPEDDTASATSNHSSSSRQLLDMEESSHTPDNSSTAGNESGSHEDMQNSVDDTQENFCSFSDTDTVPPQIVGNSPDTAQPRPAVETMYHTITVGETPSSGAFLNSADVGESNIQKVILLTVTAFVIINTVAWFVRKYYPETLPNNPGDAPQDNAQVFHSVFEPFTIYQEILNKLIFCIIPLSLLIIYNLRYYYFYRVLFLFSRFPR
jgi:hypothetical protein